MKRLLTVGIVFLFVISLACFASAEQFIIHNGVAFGMTHEDVAKLETDAGFEVGSYEEDIWTKEPSIDVKGTIAGASGAEITYQFGTNDSLHEADYNLWDKGNYQNVLTAMISKYGDPNTNADWVNANYDHSVWLSTSVAGVSIFYTINSMEWSSWLIKQDDGSFVSIDLVYMNITDKSTTDRIYISYSLKSEEEVNNLINSAKNADSNYQEQLSNDL